MPGLPPRSPAPRSASASAKATQLGGSGTPSGGGGGGGEGLELKSGWGGAKLLLTAVKAASRFHTLRGEGSTGAGSGAYAPCASAWGACQRAPPSRLPLPRQT